MFVKKTSGQLLFLSVLLLVGSCSKPVSVQNLPDRHELEMLIVKEIEPPFANFDTLILVAYRPFICGSPQAGADYLNRIYVPGTDSVVYLNELKRKIKRTVILDSDSSEMERAEKAINNFVDLSRSAKEYDAYLRNKLSLETAGELLSNDSVKIIHTYHHVDSLITIEKLFVYRHSKWTSGIIKQKLMTRDTIKGNSWTNKPR